MSITIQEYNGTPFRDLELIKKGKYFISEDGKFFVEVEAQESKKPLGERLSILKSLRGVLPKDISLEDARRERLSRI